MRVWLGEASLLSGITLCCCDAELEKCDHYEAAHSRSTHDRLPRLDMIGRQVRALPIAGETDG